MARAPRAEPLMRQDRLPSRPTDVRVVAADVRFFDERLRTPLVISTGRIDAVTRARVELVVETAQGRRASGAGEMILSALLGFPSQRVSHADRDRAMRVLTDRFAQAAVAYAEPAHPITLFQNLHETLDPLCRRGGGRAAPPRGGPRPRAPPSPP